MYCNFDDFLNTKSCTKNFSINDYRRNSFLTLQENKYRKQVNENVASPIIVQKTYSDFFSQSNIAILQNRIKNELYFRTNKKFISKEDQDENSLRIVMKHIFMEYGHLNSVDGLNHQFIEYVMPDIISSAKQYVGYIDKINSPIEPIARPLNANKKGRNQLRSITTVWS